MITITQTIIIMHNNMACMTISLHMTRPFWERSTHWRWHFQFHFSLFFLLSLVCSFVCCSIHVFCIGNHTVIFDATAMLMLMSISHFILFLYFSVHQLPAYIRRAEYIFRFHRHGIIPLLCYRLKRRWRRLLLLLILLGTSNIHISEPKNVCCLFRVWYFPFILQNIQVHTYMRVRVCVSLLSANNFNEMPFIHSHVFLFFFSMLPLLLRVLSDLAISCHYYSLRFVSIAAFSRNINTESEGQRTMAKTNNMERGRRAFCSFLPSVRCFYNFLFCLRFFFSVVAVELRTMFRLCETMSQTSAWCWNEILNEPSSAFTPLSVAPTP